MPVERLTPERRRELTRQTLLDAAAELFAQKGFVAASLDEIAELAGFSRGAIHHHFESKEDLFLAVIDRHNEHLLAAYQARLAGSDSFPLDPSGNAAQWRQVHTEGDDVLLMLEARTYALRNPQLRPRLAEVEGAAVAATVGALTSHAERTGVRWRLPVEDVAELLHATSRGLVERSAVSGIDSEPLMRAFLTMVWDASLERTTTSGRATRRSD
jgi:AcrR family transcriptional regulator